MRKIKTWRDPYDEGFSTCRLKEVEFKEGLTVLVGCNGAGKTTMLRNIEEELKCKNVPVTLYNNLHDGGHNSIESAMFFNDYALGMSMMTSSEGENICANVGILASKLGHFIRNGFIKDKMYDFKRSIMRSLNDDEEEEEEVINERWILLDAIDSGYSIDNVLELKDLFDLIIEDGKSQGMDVYIIVSANEYELASGEQCFDVMNGKYIEFTDYDDYKKFIMNSRKKKERRYKQEEV